MKVKIQKGDILSEGEYELTDRKWRHDNLPIGYPKDCSEDQIRQVIQDLSEEKNNKLLGGKNNIFWEKIINDQLRNGKDELRDRQEIRHWYEKPVGIFLLGVLIAVVAGFILFRLRWI